MLQLEVPIGFPPWLRLHCRELNVPTPIVVPENWTTPMGELTFRVGLSVSTTVAVHVAGVPIWIMDGVQLR